MTRDPATAAQVMREYSRAADDDFRERIQDGIDVQVLGLSVFAVTAAAVFRQYESATAPLVGGIAAALVGGLAYLLVPAGRSRIGSFTLAATASRPRHAACGTARAPSRRAPPFS